jgi:allophanate hydrolase subunit 1
VLYARKVDMAYIKVLAVVSFLGSIAWLIAAPGYEPGLAVVGTLSVLISLFLVEKRKARRAQQHQSVSDSSVGIQAGGSITIKNSDLNAGGDERV